MIKMTGSQKIKMNLTLILVIVLGLPLSGCNLNSGRSINNIKTTDDEQIEKINSQHTVKIDVVLKVSGAENNEYEAQIKSGQSVIDLMEVLVAKGNFEFRSKDSNLGAFVEEINRQQNDAGKNTYWLLYINGKLSDVGASQYIIKSGDMIEWKYEDTSKINFQ